MNKTSLYVIGAIVIALLIWYGTQASSNKTTGETDNSTTTTQTQGSKTNLSALIAAGTPQQCTYTDGTTSGTTYIANKQVRGDFTVKSGTTTENSHMILKNEKLYIWMDGQTQGFVADAKDSDTDVDTNSQLDLEKDLEYNCQAWRMNASMFQQPSNVTFTDMSSLTTGAGDFDFSGLGL